jgi:hypothetical protein
MKTQACEIFTELFPEADIDADFALLRALIANIQLQCKDPMTRYIELEASCGYI